MISLTLSEAEPSKQNNQKVTGLQKAGQARWETSMAGRLDELRLALQQDALVPLAARCSAELIEGGLRLSYWGNPVHITWPGLEAYAVRSGKACSLIDTALILYYLHRSDGTPLADRWVGFRELTGGAFYHQAFQGYSGDHLAKVFASTPESFHQAANQLGGLRLTGLSEYAYAFHPLPRIRLAAIFWPGDDEFPSRGAILFDAASLHYMVLDGLAILGARLAGKLQKAREV